MSTCVLRRNVDSSLIFHYPNLTEGADSDDGQICRNKECPFNGATSYGRVWRKLPENEAWSVQEHILQDHPTNQTERQLVWPNSSNIKGEVGMRDSLRTTECMAKRGLKVQPDQHMECRRRLTRCSVPLDHFSSCISPQGQQQQLHLRSHRLLAFFMIIT